jgi:hypothetical protein
MLSQASVRERRSSARDGESKKPATRTEACIDQDRQWSVGCMLIYVNRGCRDVPISASLLLGKGFVRRNTRCIAPLRASATS